MANKLVIYACGVESSTPGLGAFGAVLTYGEHVRDVSGIGVETADQDQMNLLAVVEAIGCLTRPMSCQVCVDSEYVRAGAPAEPDRNAKLWQKLASLTGEHTVEWVWNAEDSANPHYRNAQELAADALKDGEAEWAAEAADWCVGPSIDSVLTDFLDDRRAQCSPRTFKKNENVVSTLRWSIGWYTGKKLSAIPAGEIGDQLGDFFNTLVHKQFASPSELKAVRSVLPAVLGWFQAHGHLDVETAAAEIEHIKESIDEYVAIRKFVDAFSSHVEREVTDADHKAWPGEKHVQDEYLYIDDVTKDSITFEGQVGPIPVPSHIADLAEEGWQILLTAVQVDGTWRLLEVVNGEI